MWQIRKVKNAGTLFTYSSRRIRSWLNMLQWCLSVLPETKSVRKIQLLATQTSRQIYKLWHPELDEEQLPLLLEVSCRILSQHLLQSICAALRQSVTNFISPQTCPKNQQVLHQLGKALSDIAVINESSHFKFRVEYPMILAVLLLHEWNSLQNVWSSILWFLQRIFVRSTWYLGWTRTIQIQFLWTK